MDISASLNASLPGLANATVVGLGDPIANSAPATAPAPAAPTLASLTSLVTSTNVPAAAGTQASAGVTAGGAPAAPTGASQAAAGALPVQGGGGAIDPKLIAAIEELVKVLVALVAQLKLGTAGGGGPVDPTKGGGTPGLPPGKVGGADGGGVVQQSPIQSPIQAPVKSPTGGGGAPATAAPAPGAQPAPPTVGGGAPVVHTGH